MWEKIHSQHHGEQEHPRELWGLSGCLLALLSWQLKHSHPSFPQAGRSSHPGFCSDLFSSPFQSVLSICHAQYFKAPSDFLFSEHLQPVAGFFSFYLFWTIRTSSLDPVCVVPCLLRQFPVRFPKPFCPGYKSGFFHWDCGNTLFARRRHSASPAAVCSGILGRIKLSTISLPPHLSLLSHPPSFHLPQGLPCFLCL